MEELKAVKDGQDSGAVEPRRSPRDTSVDGMSAIENTQCPYIKYHDFGELCISCRTIRMPWYYRLPQPNAENGEQYVKAPRGSIVRGVMLQNSEAIAVMTPVAKLDFANKKYDEVEGLVDIMTYYSKAVAAGLRIAELYREILKMSPSKYDIPLIPDIVQAALENPALTTEEYIRKTKREIDHYIHLRVRSTHGGSQAPDSSSSFDGAPPPPPPPPPKDVSSDVEMPDFGNSKRPKVEGTFTHAPPRDKGPWEFVPGSIISEAVLGNPEPHKYFMVRQVVGDPSVKDVRQYPSWETMDWNSPKDIKSFNKWQTQVKGRMSDEPTQLPKSWTRAEKDVLKAAVEKAIATGLNRSQIDWNDIANILTNHFKDMTQPIGAPLAQPTELLPDNTIPRNTRKIQTLKEPRVGVVERAGKAVMSQAYKYGDIALLLRNNKPYKVRGVRDGDAADDEGKGAKKGRKRRRVESPEPGNKSPPKTPSTSAQQFQMQVKNINKWYKSKTKSPAPRPGKQSDFT